MRRRPRRRGSGGAPVLLVFVVLSVLAVAAGYFLGRFMVQSLLVNGKLPAWAPGGGTRPGSAAPVKPPGGTRPEEIPVRPPGTEAGGAFQVDIPRVTLYAVQTDAFSQPEKAAARVAELTGKGFAAYVAAGDLQRVYAGFFTDRAAAGKLAAALSRQGYETYVPRVEYGGQPVLLEGTGEYLTFFQQALADTAEVLLEAGRLWEYYQEGQMNEFRAGVTGLNDKVSDLGARILDTRAPAGWDALHSELGTLLSGIAKALYEMQAAPGDGAGLGWRGMTGFMETAAKYGSFVARIAAGR